MNTQYSERVSISPQPRLIVASGSIDAKIEEL